MKHHTIVCIKSVVLETPRGKLVRTDENCGMNPFDRPALETAFQVREQLGGKVTALTMGPQSSKAVLWDALALGADRGVFISDRRLADSDTLATSRALAAAIGKLAPYGLVLFGTRTADSDTGHVGPQTAQALQLPLIGYTSEIISMQKTTLQVRRTLDGFQEDYETGLPAVLTVRATNRPHRYAPLASLSSVFLDGRVEKWTLDELGLAQETIGLAGSPTQLLSMTAAGRRKRCRMLEGAAEEQVEKVINILEDGAEMC